MAEVKDWNKKIIEEFRANGGRVAVILKAERCSSYIPKARRVNRNMSTRWLIQKMTTGW